MVMVMDDKLRISIPSDSEGFVRRACPACQREFKWLHTEDEDEATEPEDRGFCCPYCAAWAPPDEWFTEAQVEYIAQVGLGAATGQLDQIFSRFNRPGGALKYTPGDRPPVPAQMPPEPNDMHRVDFECHPEDPLKVAEDWTEREGMP
jgi:hypothetical protein